MESSLKIEREVTNVLYNLFSQLLAIDLYMLKHRQQIQVILHKTAALHDTVRLDLVILTPGDNRFFVLGNEIAPTLERYYLVKPGGKSIEDNHGKKSHFLQKVSTQKVKHIRNYKPTLMIRMSKPANHKVFEMLTTSTSANARTVSFDTLFFRLEKGLFLSGEI